MSTPIPPELRAKILSAIKDDGKTIEEAAQTYNIQHDTIRRWLRGTADNAQTSSSELQRLRKENQLLKEILGSYVLEREASKKISLARETLAQAPWLPKRSVAKTFGIARSTLYVKPKQPDKDKALLGQVLEVMQDHPHYGHRRIGWAFGRNHKSIYRIMHKYGLKARRRRKTPRKRLDEKKPHSGIPNRIKGLKPTQPQEIWVGDFTYLDFHGQYVYLATVIDLFPRDVIGFSVGLFHSARLVIEALEDATRKRDPPAIFHSDQGSEYDSLLCRAWLLAHQVLPSQSHKAHPWENGHQESFFGRFKQELGDINRFGSLDELIEAIYHQIHYYNTKRIHSALKMTPQQKYEQWRLQAKLQGVNEKTISKSV